MATENQSPGKQGRTVPRKPSKEKRRKKSCRNFWMHDRVKDSTSSPSRKRIKGMAEMQYAERE